MQPEAGTEDMIESKPKSGHGTEMRRRLALLAPVSMGRKLVAGIVAVALVLGLVAGFLVGSVYGPEQTATLGVDGVAGPDAGWIPIVPGGSPVEDGIIVESVGGGYLTLEDLTSLGETVAPGGFVLHGGPGPDRRCGIADDPADSPAAQRPGAEYGNLDSVSLSLVGASLTERIGPDLDVLAASTLRGRVELSRSCSSSDGLMVRTPGIQAGIGDEYAVFTVVRSDRDPGVVETSVVVLVRVGGQLVEIALTPDGAGEVPDGFNRALRIAEVAVARMLTG